MQIIYVLMRLVTKDQFKGDYKTFIIKKGIVLFELFRTKKRFDIIDLYASDFLQKSLTERFRY